jgi:hypothetical protein
VTTTSHRTVKESFYRCLLLLRVAGEPEPVLRVHRRGDILVEDEVEGDVVGAAGVLAVGVVTDAPLMASDGERARRHVHSGGYRRGGHVAVDREEVVPARDVGLDDGGGSRRHGRQTLVCWKCRCLQFTLLRHRMLIGSDS